MAIIIRNFKTDKNGYAIQTSYSTQNEPPDDREYTPFFLIFKGRKNWEFTDEEINMTLEQARVLKRELDAFLGLPQHEG